MAFTRESRKSIVEKTRDVCKKEKLETLNHKEI